MNRLPPDVEDLIVAATGLVGRTGAMSFQIRYCDEDQPVVWMAIAEFEGTPTYSEKVPEADTSYVRELNKYQVAAGMSPMAAVFNLLEKLIDGGRCNWCKRPTGIAYPGEDESMPLEATVCWYKYNRKAKEFKRGCESLIGGN
jgi:hypothetical protein